MEPVGQARQQGQQANHLPLGIRRVEGAAMAAGLETLRHHGVGAGLLGGQRLGQGGGAGEPGDACRLQLGHERGREHAHDRRHHGRPQRQEHSRLGREIRRGGVGGSYWWSPGAEEVAHPGLGRRVARRWRVGNPDVELERAVARRPELGHPSGNPGRFGQQRPHAAHAAGVGDGHCQRRRAGTGHGRPDNGRIQREPVAEGRRPVSRGPRHGVPKPARHGGGAPPRWCRRTPAGPIPTPRTRRRSTP